LSKDKLVRFNLMISPVQLKEIDEYRQDVGTLPPKGEAIRDLIELGLKAYWEKKDSAKQED